MPCQDSLDPGARAGGWATGQPTSPTPRVPWSPGCFNGLSSGPAQQASLKVQVQIVLSSQEGTRAAWRLRLRGTRHKLIKGRVTTGFGRQHGLFLGVAIGRAQLKAAVSVGEVLLHGHFYEAMPEMDSQSSPLHSGPPSVGRGLIRLPDLSTGPRGDTWAGMLGPCRDWGGGSG